MEITKTYYTKGEWNVTPNRDMSYKIDQYTSGGAIEDAANCRLIAQSPKMYELLMKRLNVIEEELKNGMPISDYLLPEFKELLLLKKATE